MENKEKIKSEVLNYLNRSTNHLYKIDDKENKILVSGDFIIRITGNNISIIDIDQMITYYGNNSRCVIKHMLFLNPRFNYDDFDKIEGIPYYKDARKKYNKILNEISGLKNKEEIKTKIKEMSRFYSVA